MSTPNNYEPNGWAEYRKLVLKELEDLHTTSDKIKDELNAIKNEQAKIKEEIATLKVKSGVWGMMGGAIPVIIALVLWLMKIGG